MGKWAFVAMLAATLFDGQASAAEWSPIKIDDNTVREVDTASITRNGQVVTFAARHTFIDRNEYKVGRREAKYLLIHSRANCISQTLAQLATEAYDEKTVLISKQQIQLPQDLPVTKGSIDEAALNFVCKAGK
ncbi:MAG: hypothetical protein Q8O38_10155 [Sulfurimicrobium sp.]|nr:hypothetical protein [Sulfurimicrobium sp.]